MAYSAHHCGGEKSLRCKDNTLDGLSDERDKYQKVRAGVYPQGPTQTRRASATHRVQTWARLRSCGNTTLHTDTTTSPLAPSSTPSLQEEGGGDAEMEVSM
jgi:hypothetical protein